jgi:anti-anti-sigma factor
MVEYSGIPVVQVGGELDGSAVAELQSAVVAACPEDCDRIAVDLTDVTYIESAAKGALIEAHAAVEARGGRVAVICAPSDTAKIVRLSGLRHVEPVFDDPDSAVTFLSKPPPGGQIPTLGDSL